MREADWAFILRWAPSLAVILVLTIAALILQALERRSGREQDSATARK